MNYRLPTPCAVGPCKQWYKGTCFYCARPLYLTHDGITKPWTYTRDHIIPRKISNPRVKGEVKGAVFFSKQVPCCPMCNNKKGCTSARDFINEHCKQRLHKINWELIKWEENRFEEFKKTYATSRIQMPQPRQVRAIHCEPGSVLGSVSQMQASEQAG